MAAAGPVAMMSPTAVFSGAWRRTCSPSSYKTLMSGALWPGLWMMSVTVPNKTSC